MLLQHISCAMVSGKLFLIIGPSGVGKGTIISLLRKKYGEKFFFPVSATTRPPRPGEREGETYHFLTEKDFQEKIANGEFLEWARVHKEYFYGTLKAPILFTLQAGKNVLRELDIQGFETIRAHPELPQKQVISLFLLPPSLEILTERIRRRAPLTSQELEERVQSMQKELAKSELCTYRIATIDRNIPETFALVEEVLHREDAL